MNDINHVSWPGWEVVRKIGSGSFGAVYEIQRDVFGDIERAALKVITIPQSRSDIDELLNEGYDEASVTERFRGYLQDIAREYSLMAKMKGHTNVVYCDDIRYVQHEDGIGWDIYIKMELLTPMMTTLSNNIPEETAIRVGKDICSALVLCKQQNIVHRDIKPQNIFVSANGEYKLGDFGIAKTAEKTTGGTKIGTYKYMAPEVYNNQPYGAAADIYSLGLVMYWLLNGRRTPFLPLPPQTPSASAEEDARRRRFSGEPIPAPAYGSPALKNIVLKACAYDVRNRYTSPEEMLADLKALGGKGAAAAPVVQPVAAVEPLSDDDRTVSTFASGNFQPDGDATVGIFGKRVAPQDNDATIGTWGSKPKPAPAPVKAAEPAPAPVQPPVSPKKDESPKPAAEKKEKKKSRFPLIGIVAGVAALALVLMIGLGGGEEKPSGGNAGGNTGSNVSQNGGNTSSSALKGYDIFNGQWSDEMIWGYYESLDYEYSGSKDDAKEFLTDMVYKTVATERGDFEFAALPLSIQAGKYAHFMDTFLFEGEYYEPFTEKGKAMFRKAIIAENGDMTEEEFLNIEKMMELNVAEVIVTDKLGATYRLILAYKIENGKLALYDQTVDDNYNVTLTDKPLVVYDFLLDGGKLTLQCDNVQRQYVPNGYKVDDPSVYIGGYALNAENKYNDLDGLSFFQYGRDKDPTAYVYLTNGDSPIDPVMKLNYDTGDFTLTWEQCWTTYNGKTIKEDDPRSISGKIVPCTNYGFTEYIGFFLFIDGQRYDYLMSPDEYDEIMYGSVVDDSIVVEDLNTSQLDDIITTKNSILEALKEAFDAAGIEASIDFVSGKVNLEANFLFATNSAELSEEGKAYLEKFVDVYSSVVLSDEYSGHISSIMVEGHTDTSGSYSLNKTLSEKRAGSVADHCIARNSALTNVIQTTGCAYDFPIYNEDGSVNMDKSRRVTFRFILAVT